jgi:hypothetical protein
MSGNYYGLVIANHYSRFTWLLFLDDKGQVKNLFTNFGKKDQNGQEVKIKRARSNSSWSSRTTGT